MIEQGGRGQNQKKGEELEQWTKNNMRFHSLCMM
jgi:hypothetical protein